MALHIYSTSSHFYVRKPLSILQSPNYVADIEKFWRVANPVIDEVSINIIKEIDRADCKLIDGMWHVISPFGPTLIDNISTSAKATILLYCKPDMYYNFKEVGINAIKYAIEHFKTGTIILGWNYTKVSDDADIEVLVDEIPTLYTKGEDYNEWCV